jgi:hypothetical protein
MAYDDHWIPTECPTPVLPEEEARQIRTAEERMRKGVTPSRVTRELLLGGVSAPAVRSFLASAQIGLPDTQQRGAGSIEDFLFGGHGAGQSGEDMGQLASAHDDLDMWTTIFP